DLAHLDAPGATELAGEPRRQRPLLPADAEVGAAEPALGHQRADDLPGRGVDRHSEAETDTGDRRVDADHAAAAVGERAARIAGIESGVGLDDVVDDAYVHSGARRQRASERRHDTRGDRAGEAVRVPDRDDE